MALGTHYIRLERDVNMRATVQARQAGKVKSELLTAMIEEYAAGPAPEPKPKPVDDRDMVESRLAIADEVWLKAQQRARAEGKGDLSTALTEMIRADS